MAQVRTAATRSVVRRRRSPKLEARKRPEQARSRETVDAILAATAKLCVRDGVEKTSTNRIAETAGVSIGSLYQYFSSKEAVLAALLERHENRMLKVISSHLVELDQEDLPALARTLVGAVLDAHKVEPGLHRVLLEQGINKGPRAVDRAIQDLIKNALLRRRSEVQIGDVEVGAFLLVAAVEAACHQAVHDRPELLKRDALLEELTDLVVRYALKPRRKRR
jgi:AcrR family transcriptional regulator